MARPPSHNAKAPSSTPEQRTFLLNSYGKTKVWFSEKNSLWKSCYYAIFPLVSTFSLSSFWHFGVNTVITMTDRNRKNTFVNTSISHKQNTQWTFFLVRNSKVYLYILIVECNWSQLCCWWLSVLCSDNWYLSSRTTHRSQCCDSDCSHNGHMLSLMHQRDLNYNQRWSVPSCGQGNTSL